MGPGDPKATGRPGPAGAGATPSPARRDAPTVIGGRCQVTNIRFEQVSKQYEPGVYALAGLNLELGPGELVTLVGPSGSGKSTALRILAGLETATHGHVVIDGTVVDEVPTRLRGLGLVTQDNALLAHRTARDNIALPLELRRRDNRDTKIEELASELAIGHLLSRRPKQLSGGEIQAVQLARALVALPDIWLLDEPLARLDPVLRRSLRSDIVRLQQRRRVTTLMATADQADATAMSTRIAMLVGGRLQQTGTPSDLHDAPVNLAVARFFGEPTMNVVTAQVVGSDRERWYRLLGVEVPAWPEITRRYVGRDLLVGFRPHDLAVPAAVSRAPRIAGRVVRVERLGSHAVTHLDVGGHETLRWSAPGRGPDPGERVELVVEPGRFHLFDPLSEAALWHPTGEWTR